MNELDEPRERFWLVLGVVCVVASPAAAYAAQRAHGWMIALFFALQLLVTGLAFAIPQARALAAKRRERTSEQREVEARIDTRATINDALDPVLRILVEISAERSQQARDQLIAQAIPFVLNAASNLIGSERSRACWFELTDDVQPELVPRLSAGRSGSPTTTFSVGSPAGDAAIGMVLRGESLLCPDIETVPPPGWDATKQRDYATFVSVSVTTADTAYGMLTLDALEVGALTTDDLNMLGLMASALAAALAQRG